jgi:hypothetical protein
MIKKQLLVLVFILLTGQSFAQITVYESDISNIGDIIYQYTESPTSPFTVGSSGLNQIWDFSGVGNNINSVLLFVDPIGSPYELQYPNANLCLQDGGTYSYYNKTPTGLFLHGLGDTVFNSPALYLPLPLTYGLDTSDGPIIVIEEVITGPLLSIYIPDSVVSVLTSGAANRADQALIKITNVTDFLVDASGSMTTDLGTFDVLRLKTTTYTNSELDVLCVDTATNQTLWITNIPFSLIPALAGFSNNGIDYKYQWITDDNSVSFLICEAVVDLNDNIDNWTLQIPVPPSYIADNKEDRFKVFPNPTTDFITIELLNNNKVSVQLSDVFGKVIMKSSLQNTTQLNISSYAAGIYYLTLKSEEQSVTKKIIVE